MKKITNSNELLAEFHKNGINIGMHEMFYFGKSNFASSLNNLKKTIKYKEKELEKYKEIYERCEKIND